MTRAVPDWSAKVHASCRLGEPTYTNAPVILIGLFALMSTY